MEAITDPGLLLKVTPPKLRKALLARERLRRLGAGDDDVAVMLVEAPAGYGKTSLMAQWRLDWLQSGAAVGWLSLETGDGPMTLVSGIALSLRRSIGQRGFGSAAIEAVRRGTGAESALTMLLAEITEASRPMVMVFDNGERLGDHDAIEVLSYLLHNLPPNLRVVIGTRSPLGTETLDLLGQGLLRRVTAMELRFDLSETIRLLTDRSRGRIDPDLCARLHDITGGWPLGLQLAAAALERAADPRAAIEDFLRSRDDATQHLFEALVASLPGGLGDFLTRCALLDSLHPSLCEAVTGDEDAGLSLQRVLVATPLLSAAEEGEWLRMHPLAREYLHARAESLLTADERRDIHSRASRWLAAYGSLGPAAEHALAAGLEREALEMISAALRGEFDQGHHGAVIDWLARIPPRAIASNHQLRLVALWMHALAFHIGDVSQHAAALIGDPAAEGSVRAEAMVAMASAYAMLDRHEEVRRQVSQSEAASPGLTARQVLAYLHADLAINAGQTVRGRRLLAQSAAFGLQPVTEVWYDFLTVWSYLWEGSPAMAEQVSRMQQARWEVRAGRREPWTALLSAVLAGACWQQDLREDARTLLADRLDLIEQASGYGALIHAYLARARMAAVDGDDPRAFAYLESLAAIGEQREMVRLTVVSLSERVRLHAARRRPVQAAAVLAELATTVERAQVSDLLTPQLRLELELARVYVAVVSGDLVGAGVPLARARELSASLNRGYESVQALALQALLAERAGGSPTELLTEALSRAESGGLVRVFADTLPEVVDLVRRRSQEGPIGIVTHGFIGRVLAAAEMRKTGEGPAGTPAGSALFTPKEYQVLRLLAGGLPNKRIAAELDLSAETVKWHVKKLLAKLNAGSRDHAVARARMLGLLQ